LWEAARAYSREAAYPEQPFPVTGSGAHCVLCQQPLGEEAARRLTSFEAFVQDESKRREQDAADTYDELIEQLSSQVFLMKGLPVFAALIRDDIGEAELAQALRRQIVQLSWRLRAVLRTHSREVLPTLPPAAVVSLHGLRGILDGIATRIEGLQSEVNSPQRAALVAERDGLADRKWLGVVKADLLAQIERAKAVEALEKAGKTLPRTRSRRRARGSPRPWLPTACAAASQSRSTSSALQASRSSFSRPRPPPASPSSKCV
jgi:hypothetical protein